MRADHDVDGAGLEPLDDGALLGRGAEPRQAFDPHRPVREPVGECLGMLLRQQGRRHQHRDLAPARDGGERGAQRDLGLAEADVAADHAVHRPARTHVGEHGLDGLVLVDRLLEWEGRLERAIGVFVEGQRAAVAGRAPRVEVEEFGGHVADSLGGAPPGAGPLFGAEPVPGRGFRRAARIARDAFQGVHRHVEQVAALRTRCTRNSAGLPATCMTLRPR